MKEVSSPLLSSLADFSHAIYQSSEGVIETGLDELVLADVFLKEVDRHCKQLIWHIWPLEKTIILGMADCRLPYLPQGITMIRQQGYTPLVRSIGGLAVVADMGIVNLSLVLPNQLGKDKLDMGQAYQLMVACLREILPLEEQNLEVREIKDSYCPGTYDLSIRGKKFAGLAQRRIKSGIAISAYISVSGSQEKRGELIRDFYQAAADETGVDVTYPQVNPASMATLSDLLNHALEPADVVAGLHRFMTSLGQAPTPYHLTMDNLADFAKGRKEAMERHQKVGLL